MNIFFILIRAVLLVTLVLIGTITAQAQTVTLSDGTLDQTSHAPYGFGIQETLGSEFNTANGPMTFSGTMSRTYGSELGFSAYNLGMTVGSIYFLVHPGYTPVPGAFRYDNWVVAPQNVIDEEKGNTYVTQGNTSNIDIGYVVDARDIDFTVILADAGNDNYSVDVSIVQGGNSFLDTFTLSQSWFGTDGSIDSFGANHVGFGEGYGAVSYSNFTAHVSSAPEISATGALAAFGSLLALMAFLWERRRQPLVQTRRALANAR